MADPQETRDLVRRLIRAHLGSIVEETHQATVILTTELEQISETSASASQAAADQGAGAVDDGAAERQLELFEAHVSARLEEMRRGQQAIDQLTEEFARIGDVVSELHEIANVGTLLAVNSAIEASRLSAAGSGLAALASETRAHARDSTNIARDLLKRVRTVDQSIQDHFSHSREGIQAEEKLLTSVADRLGAAVQSSRERQARQREELAALERHNHELHLQILDAMGHLQFQDRLAQAVDTVFKLVDILVEPEGADLDDRRLYTMQSQRDIHAEVVGRPIEENDESEVELF